MSGTPGFGSITFGSVIVGVYSTEAGVEMDGATYTELQCTVDTDTGGMVWVAGDTPDWGQLKATIFVTSMNLNSLAGTSETLTWTKPDGDTESGSAFLVSVPQNAAQNTLVTSPLVFRWEGPVTYTAAP